MSKVDFNSVRFADFIKGLDYLAELIDVDRGKIEGWIGFWLDEEQKAKLIQAANNYNAFYELPMDKRIDLLNKHNATPTQEPTKAKPVDKEKL